MSICKGLSFLTVVFAAQLSFGSVDCNRNVACGAYNGITLIKDNIGATVDKWAETIILSPGKSSTEVKAVFAVTYMNGDQQREEVILKFNDGNFQIFTTKNILVGKGSCSSDSCEYSYNSIVGVAIGTLTFSEEKLGRTQVQKQKNGTEYYITQILSKI